jgi:hypothetical protein
MSLRLLATPLLAASLLLSTLSCSKKEDAAPTLEGTWDDISFVSTAYANGQPQAPQTTLQPGRNDPNGSYQVITGTTIKSYYNNGTAIGPVEYYTRSGNTLTISTIPTGSSTPTVVQTATITQLTATDLTLQIKVPGGQSSPYDYFITDSHSKRR